MKRLSGPTPWVRLQIIYYLIWWLFFLAAAVGAMQFGSFLAILSFAGIVGSYFGNRILQSGVFIDGNAIVVRNLRKTYRVPASDIRLFSLESTRVSDVERLSRLRLERWVGVMHLTTGQSIQA